MAHRLSKAHLISKDPIKAIVPERHHPLDPLQLIWPEVSLDEWHQILLHLHYAHTQLIQHPIMLLCERVIAVRMALLQLCSGGLSERPGAEPLQDMGCRT